MDSFEKYLRAAMAASDEPPAELLAFLGVGASDPQVENVLQRQRDFFATGATKSVGWRCGQIKTLCLAITAESERISAAQAPKLPCEPGERPLS